MLKFNIICKSCCKSNFLWIFWYCIN